MIKKNVQVSQYELPVNVVPQKSGGFTAVCPTWKDCYAQGDSLEEATLEITAVAQALIELYQEEGLHVPLKLRQKAPLASLFTVPVFVSA